MNGIVSRLETLFLPLRIAAAFGGPHPLSLLLKSYRVIASIGIGKRRSEIIELSFRGVRIPFHLESSTDFALIREVFLDEEYRHELLSDIRTIFDIGANVGAASLYFHALYPDAIIHAFEPDPDIYTKLVERTKDIPQIVTHKYALGAADGIATFYATGSSLAGSLLPRGGTQSDVPVRSIASVAHELKLSKIDLVKFDIEGAERTLFEDAANRAPCRALIGEVHLDLMGLSEEEEFLALLPEYDASYVRNLGKRRYILYGTRKK